jgi:hypothetical protein
MKYSAPAAEKMQANCAGVRGQYGAGGLIKKRAGSRVCWAESAYRLSTRLTDYSHYQKPPVEQPRCGSSNPF